MIVLRDRTRDTSRTGYLFCVVPTMEKANFVEYLSTVHCTYDVTQKKLKLDYFNEPTAISSADDDVLLTDTSASAIL